MSDNLPHPRDVLIQLIATEICDLFNKHSNLIETTFSSLGGGIMNILVNVVSQAIRDLTEADKFSTVFDDVMSYFKQMKEMHLGDIEQSKANEKTIN